MPNTFLRAPAISPPENPARCRALATSPTVVNYFIGAALTGTINGEKVTGSLNKLPPTKGNSFGKALANNFANSFTFASLTGLASLLVSAGMLYYMAKGHKMAVSKEKSDALENARNKSDADKKEAAVEQQYQANDVIEVIAPAVNHIGMNVIPKAEEIQGMQEVIKQDVDVLSTVLENGAPSQDIETAARGTAELQKNLEAITEPNMTSATRGTVLNNMDGKLNAVGDSLKREVENKESTLSEIEKVSALKAQEAITEQEAVTEAMKNAQQEQEKDDENEPREDVEKGDFEEAGIDRA